MGLLGFNKAIHQPQWTSRRLCGSGRSTFVQALSRRLVPWSLAGVLALGGAGALLAGCAPPQQGKSTAGTTIGAPFKLVDQDGKPADESVLKGTWTVLFFGYTFCPDACPTTLTKLGAATQVLGPKATKLHTVLISIDPVRDTPKQLKAYITSPVFPKDMTALTGTPEQIAAVAKDYGVYYAKNGEGQDYLVDHSTALYLFNPSGKFVELVRPDTTPDELAATISAAMTKG